MAAILKNDSVAIAQQESSLTVAKAYDGDNFRALLAAGSAEQGVMGLAALLMRTAKKMEVTNKTSDYSGLAEELFFDNPTLTMEDFTLLFKRGRRGDYGHNFNRLDVEVVNDWLRAYEAEKAAEREKRNYNRNIDNKKDMDSPEFASRYYEVRRQLGYNDKPKPTMSEEETAALTSSDAFYEYVKKYINQFNPTKLGSLYQKEKTKSNHTVDERIIELLELRAVSQGFNLESLEAVRQPEKVRAAQRKLDDLLIDSANSSEAMVKVMQGRLKDLNTEEFLQAKARTERAVSEHPKKYDLYMKAVMLEDKRRNGNPVR